MSGRLLRLSTPLRVSTGGKSGSASGIAWYAIQSWPARSVITEWCPGPANPSPLEVST